EQNHLAVFRCVGSQRKGALKRLMVFDDMIRWQNQQQFVAAIFDELHRSYSNCGCGIAAEGFKHEPLDLQLARRQLLFDDKTMFLVANQQRWLHPLKSKTLNGLLEQRLLSCQRQELLGERFARKRPKPGTTAA